eukprot:52546-Eustigmatos_ZCMA.PRE.1
MLRGRRAANSDTVIDLKVGAWYHEPSQTPDLRDPTHALSPVPKLWHALVVAQQRAEMIPQSSSFGAMKYLVADWSERDRRDTEPS